MHARLKAFLVVGLSHGVGQFSAAVHLENVDGHILWRRPEPWTFSVGPGDANAAVLIEAVEEFFRELGSYFYVVSVTPGGQEFRVRFEVAPPLSTPSVPQAEQK